MHSSRPPSVPLALSLSLLLLVAALLQSPASANAKVPAGKIRGMAFTSGHNLWAYRQPFATKSLANLKKTGTQYVHITVILGQKGLNSYETYTITDFASMRYIIRKVRKAGFKVFLKPIVQTPNFQWRGFIKGGPRWFNTVYNPWIVKVAKLAQEEGVEIFSVGSELRETLFQTSNWEKTIRKIRAVFKGPLTYVGNHDGYQQAKFWKSLDFISISGYFKLLNSWNPRRPPTKQQTYALWKKEADEVNAWRMKNGLQGKKVLLAEAGAMSKGGGVVYTRPWAYEASGPVDVQVQALIYEAIFRAWMSPKWSLGVIMYDWDARPDAGKAGSSLRKHYTPQNKPAQWVMTRWYKRKSY